MTGSCARHVNREPTATADRATAYPFVCARARVRIVSQRLFAACAGVHRLVLRLAVAIGARAKSCLTGAGNPERAWPTGWSLRVGWRERRFEVVAARA